MSMTYARAPTPSSLQPFDAVISYVDRPEAVFIQRKENAGELQALRSELTKLYSNALVRKDYTVEENAVSTFWFAL